MQSENGPTHNLFKENLNFAMVESGVWNINFKDFMADNAHANRNVVGKIYGEVGMSPAYGWSWVY